MLDGLPDGEQGVDVELALAGVLQTRGLIEFASSRGESLNGRIEFAGERVAELRDSVGRRRVVAFAPRHDHFEQRGLLPRAEFHGP